MGAPDERTSRRLPARDAAGLVAAALADVGFIAYFAGGCVRDRLLGIEPVDYDIATDATPEQIGTLFPSARGVGASFGVMLVRSAGHTIEVATFRRDGTYSDGRRPERVEFGNAEQDAGRRDFTVNGLFEEPATGRIIDFVGGVDDIRRRRLRAIGSAEDRLAEDRLRMLRAARFAARFELDVDPEVEAAIRRHASDLMGVSRERVGGEIRRVLNHPSRGRGIRLIEDLGLAPAVLCEAAVPLEDERVRRLSPSSGIPASLAAWMLDRDSSHLGAGQERQRSWTRALVLSNDESEGLLVCLRLSGTLRDGWSGMDMAARKRTASTRWFAEALDLLRAERPALAEEIATDVEKLSVNGLAPAAMVTGDDLVEIGLHPGPAFKKILEQLYDRQLRGEFPGRDAALAAARQMNRD